jgi:hypothetical protein
VCWSVGSREGDLSVTYGALDVVVMVLLAGGAITHGYGILVVRRPRDGRRPQVRTVALELLAWPSIALLILSQLANAGDRHVSIDSTWLLVALVGTLALLVVALAYRTFILRR